MNAPFFIVGTERSGSNLLRVILDAHSRLAVPHPPHVMNLLGPVEHCFGDLAQDENLRKLAREVGRLVRLHIHPWDFAVDVEQLVTDASPRDLFGLFVALYEQNQRHEGKARWGCKSTFMIHHVDRILARFPDARLLHLVRDPRDVAVSSRDSVFNPSHPYFVARLWTEQQELAHALAGRLGADTMLRVRYEDLIADPEASVRAICAFLGEEFEESILRFFERDATRKGAALSQSWANTGRPVMSDNAGKFGRELDAQEIALIEGVAGEMMELHGYARVAERQAPPTGARLRFLPSELLGNARTELRSLRDDENHWIRVRRDGLARLWRLRGRMTPRGSARPQGATTGRGR